MSKKLETMTETIDGFVSFKFFEAADQPGRNPGDRLYGSKTLAPLAIGPSPIAKPDKGGIQIMTPGAESKTLVTKAASMPKPRSVLAAACTAIALIISLFVCAGSAYASSNDGDVYYTNGECATVDNLKGTVYLVYYPKKPSSNTYYIYSIDWPAESINNLKSSNPKVIKASINRQVSVSLKLKVMKAGSTTLSYELDGEKRTAKLIVRKYKKPFSKFKIGKKSFASAFKKTGIIWFSKELKGKLKIKPAKGWKLKRLVYCDFEKDKTKKIKSGYKFRKNTADYTVVATFKNKKTKVLQDIELWVSPM